MMKMLKAEGIQNVTAEVCPHHFILTSDDIERDDPNYKMNPPLRTRKDVDALIEGLKEGYIQVDQHRPCSSYPEGQDRFHAHRSIWNCRN